MSKECDVFFDSYGCIITRSVGYQAPFPIVRLGNGRVSRESDEAHVQAACFASSPLPEQNASRGRLLTLAIPGQDSCVSFLQLIDTMRKPLTLDHDVEYVKKLEAAGNSSVVVTRAERNHWSTSLYTQKAAEGGELQSTRVLFRRTSSACVWDSVLWLVEMAKEESEPRQLHHYALECALSGGLSMSSHIHESVGRPLDVLAQSHDTAIVLGSRGVALADRRASLANAVVAAPIANGAVAGDDKLVVFGEDHLLRVYDQRKWTVPLFEASTASYLCVKSVAGVRAALLVAGDTVGVFDTSQMTAAASLQHSGDTVLDAVPLPVSAGGGTRVLASTGSGMVYDWTVAM